MCNVLARIERGKMKCKNLYECFKISINLRVFFFQFIPITKIALSPSNSIDASFSFNF